MLKSTFPPAPLCPGMPSCPCPQWPCPCPCPRWPCRCPNPQWPCPCPYPNPQRPCPYPCPQFLASSTLPSVTGKRKTKKKKRLNQPQCLILLRSGKGNSKILICYSLCGYRERFSSYSLNYYLIFLSQENLKPQMCRGKVVTKH